jgi:hypothetical protein
MPVRCSTVDAPALVRYAFEGAWVALDLLDLRRELVQAGKLTANTAVLFDLRQATTFPALADLHPALTTEGIWPVCRAFLVSTEEQHSCAQQLQALLGPHRVINEIFRDETTAHEWLSAMAGRVDSIKA